MNTSCITQDRLSGQNLIAKLGSEMDFIIDPIGGSWQLMSGMSGAGFLHFLQPQPQCTDQS